MDNLTFLKYKAYKLRVDSLIATTQANSGHLTSALSAADIIAALFFKVMNYNFEDKFDENNDRFILSKGHAVPVLYSAFKESGVIDKEELLTYRNIDSVLEGHPTSRFFYNEAATGSLGQGLSIGLGMALAAKLKKKRYYTYVMLGDSEMAEGSVWEAIQIASFYNLDNLIAIVDFNRLGQSTETIDDHNSKKHAEKWKGFSWNTIIIDGHDIKEILKSFQEAKDSKKPTVIIAKTYKGYGIDLVEDEPNYHGKALPKNKLDFFLNNLKERFSDVSNLDFKVEKVYPKRSKPDSLKNIYLDLKDYDIYKNNKEKITTRKAYGQAIAYLGNYTENILSLDAEVKNSTYAQIFQDLHKDRFIQCFISEQNMINMATGLTSRGFVPFSSTFASFLTRAHDQIRMAAIGKVPLRVAGIHAGVSVGKDGPSQMGLEDIALFRALPESIIFYPSDAISTQKLVNLMYNYSSGISYIRLTRPETDIIYDITEEFKIGGFKILQESDKDKLCIITAGITLFEALKVYKELKSENILVSIIDLYSIKPIDSDNLIKIINKSNNIVITVEDHYLEGGLGETVNSLLINKNIKIKNLAVKILPRSGDYKDLMALCKIDYKAIKEAVYDILRD